MTKSSQKSVKIVYVFFNLHTLKCKENLYLEYLNINHESAVTRLMIDIKHQADRVLVDIWYQTSTRCSSGWHLISNINQIEFWLTFDIKHQPDRVLVDVWYQMTTRTASRLMFDIKLQPELYLVDVWYQSSSGWLLVYDWYSFTLDVWVGAHMMLWQATGAPLPSWDWGHARRSDSQPKPTLPTGCRGRARHSGTRPVLPAHWGPALLWRSWSPLPTGGPGSHASLWRGRSLPCPQGGWDRACCPGAAGVPPAHQGPGTRAFDIKCQPELSLVDVLYQSLRGWLLVHDWYSFTLGICFLCISGYVDSKKVSGGQGRARRSGARPEPSLPTGCRGHERCSDARLESPAHPG